MRHTVSARGLPFSILALLTALALAGCGGNGGGGGPSGSRAGKYPPLRDPGLRVFVIGFDGMAPQLLEKYMADGELPNFSKLKARGDYAPLGSTNPAESPVAWSSFTTGVNPGMHGIFDFIFRDPETYMPNITGLEKQNPEFDGDEQKEGYRYVSTRGGTAFWVTARKDGIASVAQQVPSNFPLPDLPDCYATAGLEIPDIRGTQASPVLFTTDEQRVENDEDDKVFLLIEEGGGKYSADLTGPWNPAVSQRIKELTEKERDLYDQLQEGGVDRAKIRKERSEVKRQIEELKRERKVMLPLTVRKGGDVAADRLEIEISGEEKTVAVREWSDWFDVQFPFTSQAGVNGITKFWVESIDPEIEVYAAPVEWDPRQPPYPISHPREWYAELVDRVGLMKTRGWAAETAGLKDENLSEEAFLLDLKALMDVRTKIFFYTLETKKVPLYVAVFSTTDRLQHMFFNHLDPLHPLYDPERAKRYAPEILNLYRKADEIVGRIMDQMGEKDVLMVMSDHGFAPFRRGLNVNTWLVRNGFMKLRGQGSRTTDLEGLFTDQDFFRNTDWSRTKAYALGLGQVYINLKGRERDGIVPPEEYLEACEQIRKGLLSLRDPASGEQVVRNVYLRDEIWDGPYLEKPPGSPDMMLGFNEGFRVSWSTCLGGVPAETVEDNTQKWTGDHSSVDPDLVKGILVCNRKITVEEPDITDIAPTVLSLLGSKVPTELEGEVLFATGATAAAD